MNPPHPISGAVALSHLGAIRAQGADAARFLHGQLTNDFSTLGLSRARLAGYCSAKGRLQASFIAWKESPDAVLLLCSASVLQATLKRLSMFVMRAQCKLSDASADLAVWGVAGEPAQALLAGAEVWEKRELGATSVIRLPDAAGLCRALHVGSAAQGLAAPHTSVAMTLDQWRWLEVQSGLPIIEAATVEKFVPQMLNFELIGGVDFKKGCYPGQEIVARSQYRGTTKRRMFLFGCESACVAGQEVFHSNDAGQPAGMVVNAARRPAGGGSSALVEVKLAALAAGSLHLATANGPVLSRETLPYQVPLEPESSA